MLRDRERILDMFEMTCGARLLYNYMWVGGVSHDLPKGFVETAFQFLDYFEPQIDEYNKLLTYNKIFVERTADIGVLPADVAISYGVSGPNLRASGVKWDLRRNAPYSIYDKFEFDVCIGDGAGFESSTNRVTIFSKNGHNIELKKDRKDRVAKKIIQYVLNN